MRRKIVGTIIYAEWNDNPKLDRVDHEMPESLRQEYDKWLESIEHEENQGMEEEYE
jgi:DNA-binding transcriptional regulator YbjK|tara:strand:- start:189 stop:356 length:168 start_codon:yes stop_codon:yes gene_type:complete